MLPPKVILIAIATLLVLLLIIIYAPDHRIAGVAGIVCLLIGLYVGYESGCKWPYSTGQTVSPVVALTPQRPSPLASAPLMPQRASPLTSQRASLLTGGGERDDIDIDALLYDLAPPAPIAPDVPSEHREHREHHKKHRDREHRHSSRH
jgi:hypothetical protein